MANITLYQRPGKDKNTEAFIWIQFYLERKKVNFSTKTACLPKHWNEKTSRVSAADKTFKDKNLILETLLARVNKVMVNYKLKNKVLTRDAFVKAYNRPDDYDSFYSFCKDYKRKIAYRTEPTTMNVHTTVLKKLEEYAPELHFDDITIDFLNEYYYKHLRKKLENNENTAYKNMSTIRKYVNAAVKTGYMDESPFAEFHIKRTKASYTYLEEHELLKLMQLYRTNILDAKLQKSLQFFLYMCFSSQHVTDARAMKIQQFEENSFVYYRVKLRNKKPDPITVPISGMLREIVTDAADGRKSGVLFVDLYSDQKMNDHYKAICKLDEVNIKKSISHKAGRHTFATFYLSKTKDLNTLKDILGHSDIRETLNYAHVLEREKQKSISCFDVFMEVDKKKPETN